MRGRIASCFGLLVAGAGSYRLAAAQAGDAVAVQVPAAVMLVLLVLLVAAAAFLVRREQQAPYAYLYRRDGRRLRVTRDISRIGRHAGNELRIKQRTVSRFHAELVRHPTGAFVIHDAGSRNGVRVGSRPSHASVLRDGDLIDLGEVRLRFSRRPRDYNMYADTELHAAGAGRMQAHRRREPRREVNAQVRLYHETTGWVTGRMRNVSREGAYIETGTPLGTRLPVDMVVQIVEGERRSWRYVSAEVVRRDRGGVGLMFTDRDPALFDLL